jgi:gluconolactonase
VKSDGSIYFTDYGAQGKLPASVYRWKEGTLQLLTNKIQGGRVNGIALSPDEKFLYIVAILEAAPRRIVRYNVRPDGAIADERLFFSLPVEKTLATRESGRPDGVKVDGRGNVYFGGPGGLWIVSPGGKHLGTILIDGGHTNLAFGDTDGKGLYLTTGHGLARIRLNAPAL